MPRSRHPRRRRPVESRPLAIGNVDRPRLFHGETQNCENALSGLSDAHPRVTLSGSSSTLRDERRPVSFAKARRERTGSRVVQGRNGRNILACGVARVGGRNCRPCPMGALGRRRLSRHRGVADRLRAVAVQGRMAFHGYPLRRLNSLFGLWVSQFVIALVFAAEHVAGGWTWTQALFGAGVGSFFLAWPRSRQKDWQYQSGCTPP
jgi:hypothetical protein